MFFNVGFRFKILVCSLFLAFFIVGCEKKDQASGVDLPLNNDWRDASEKIDGLSFDENYLAKAKSLEDNSFLDSSLLGGSKSSQPEGKVEAGGFSEARAKQAYNVSKTSGISGGLCGKGVRAILNNMKPPIPNEVPMTGANGTNYYGYLSKSPGWVKLECKPEECPLGTVLTYSATGQPPGVNGKCSTEGGCKYGHVEMVTLNNNNKRQYCFGSCNDHAGGTVRKNFAGAFIYQGEIK